MHYFVLGKQLQCFGDFDDYLAEFVLVFSNTVVQRFVLTLIPLSHTKVTR